MSSNNSNSSSGIGCFGMIGIVLAVLISWTLNHSVLWAIFHACLGWIYVIYRVVFAGQVLF